MKGFENLHHIEGWGGKFRFLLDFPMSFSVFWARTVMIKVFLLGFPIYCPGEGQDEVVLFLFSQFRQH